MHSIRALYQLLRVGNVLFAGIAVLVGGGLATHWQALPSALIWGAIAAATIAAGANAANDVYDLPSDRINRPQRPLPSGALTVRTAVAIACLLSIAGIACGAFITPLWRFVPFAVALWLWQYNRDWKRRPWLGNIAVAICGAITPLWGAALAGDTAAATMPALLAGIAFFAREVAKDVEDAAGDVAAGFRTTAVACRKKTVRLIVQLTVTALLLIVILLFFLPRFRNITFIVMNMAAAIVVLRALSYSITISDEPAAWRKLGDWLKRAMAAGLLAFAVGAVGL